MVSFHRRTKDLLAVVILKAIRSLPERDREIFVLKHYDGLSDIEISVATGLPLPAVQGSLRTSTTRLLCQLRPLASHPFPARVPRHGRERGNS